jgi:hypothetical protein
LRRLNDAMKRGTRSFNIVIMMEVLSEEWSTKFLRRVLWCFDAIQQQFMLFAFMELIRVVIL